jgi:2-keto-4-pentenoate hydratase/2-oxohepta-3-ene-1,7-dioic acid hydratase in catechol pathway
VTGHRHPIVLPKNSAKPDYEAEFAVVIGKGGRYIPEERWREHVFGYTIANDVSARDFQMATTQWMIGKTFDTFAPIGPAIVTADEIEDPHKLDISLTHEWRGVAELEHAPPDFRRAEADRIFVERLHAGAGRHYFATGTPAGVGFARKPPRWLKPGDEAWLVRVEGLLGNW